MRVCLFMLLLAIALATSSLVGAQTVPLQIVPPAPTRPPVELISPGGLPPTPADRINSTANQPPPTSELPEISPNAEGWRYVWQNGAWWYFLPTKKWMYWSDGRWVEHVPAAYSNAPTYVQPPAPAVYPALPRPRVGIGVGVPYYYPYSYGPATANPYRYGYRYPYYYGRPGIGFGIY